MTDKNGQEVRAFDIVDYLICRGAVNEKIECLVGYPVYLGTNLKEYICMWPFPFSSTNFGHLVARSQDIILKPDMTEQFRTKLMSYPNGRVVFNRANKLIGR